MRRLLITTGIFPPDIGGPARFVPQLAAKAASDGWLVDVVTLGECKETCEIDGYTVHKIARFPRVQRVPNLIRTLLPLARTASVIFSNGLYPETSLVAKLTKTPWVSKIVGDPVWERSARGRQPIENFNEFQNRRLRGFQAIERRILTMALATCCKLIVPSDQLRLALSSWGLPPAAVIANGVPIRPLVRQEPTVDVVTVCRLVPWKGLENLIIACASESLSLLIVGDGPQREELQMMIDRLNCNDTIRISGSVNADEVTSVIERARIFCLNSSYEGASFSLLEARERGLACIAGKNSGNDAIINDGMDGLIVDPTSLEELRCGLGQLSSDHGRRIALGDAARAHVQTNNNLRITLNETLDTITQCAKRTH